MELFKPARCPHHGGRETLPSRWGTEGVPQVRAEDRRPGISSPRGSDDWIWGHSKFPLLTDGLYSFLFGISPCMVFLSHGMEASPWTLRLSVASGSGWQDWQGLRCCLVWSWGTAHTFWASHLLGLSSCTAVQQRVGKERAQGSGRTNAASPKAGTARSLAAPSDSQTAQPGAPEAKLSLI